MGNILQLAEIKKIIITRKALRFYLVKLQIINARD